MGQESDRAPPVRNSHYLKERQEWLKLYQSACQQIGGKRWRRHEREELLTKVETLLWQVMRTKGMHHVSFRRKCRMARETLTG